MTENTQLHEQILQRLATIEAVSKSTLTQAKLTNGRVTTLEGRANGHDTSIALLNKDVLANTNIITREDKVKNQVWSILIQSAVTGALVILVLMLTKTGILNLENEPKTREDVYEELKIKEAEIEALSEKLKTLQSAELEKIQQELQVAPTQ